MVRHNEQAKQLATRRVTLRTVADALGVSTATVSLAINSNPLVAKKTQVRVQEKIKELGYVYNRAAAGLRTDKTQTIGFAAHDVSNSTFPPMMKAVDGVMMPKGRMVFLSNIAESLDRQKEIIATLSEFNVDGLIISPAIGTKSEDLAPLIDYNGATVLIIRDIEGVDFDFVGNDEALAIKRGTQHLIELGHKKIAMIGGGQDTYTGHHRRGGFIAALNEAGLATGEGMLVNCGNGRRDGMDALKKIMALSSPPTGVVCFNDQLAFGAMAGLHEMGMMPGRDVAVVGCDDVEEAALTYPPLTTTNMQQSEIGRLAGELLLQRIADPNGPRHRIIMKPELSIRQSCGSRLS